MRPLTEGITKLLHIAYTDGMDQLGRNGFMLLTNWKEILPSAIEDLNPLQKDI